MSVGRITCTNETRARIGYRNSHARLNRITNGMWRMIRPSPPVMWPTIESGGGSRMFLSSCLSRMGADPGGILLQPYVVDLEAERTRRPHGADADGAHSLEIRRAVLCEFEPHFVPFGSRIEVDHERNGVQLDSRDHHEHVAPAVAAGLEGQRRLARVVHQALH